MALINPKSQDSLTSFGLFAMRVVVGVALCFHGWPKMANISDWMHPDPTPGYLQALAALSEFVGGIALALGLLTPLAALGIFCTMAYAVNYHFSKGDPFIARGDSYEQALTYAVVSMCILLAGPGKLSLDSMLFGGKNKKK